MIDTLYTIGYAGFSIDSFLRAMEKYGISVVIDVRSSPFSGYFADFNKDALEARLRDRGIHYRNYAREFGARQDDPAYYSPEGYLDFERFARSEPFLQGVEKLCESMRRDYRPALMCAEKDPMSCHRAILVSRAFFERGYHVVHLLPEDGSTTQEEVEQRLLEEYFPDRHQMSLFGEAESDAALREAAYREQNRRIGYRMEET